MQITQGTAALIVGYGVALLGIIAGLIRARAAPRRWPVAPLLAAAVAVASALLWSIVLGALPRLASVLDARARSVVGGALTLAAGLMAGIVAAGRNHDARVERGARIVDTSVSLVTAVVRRRDTIRLAGQPVPPLDESKHFKLIGTTGTGKSTAIRELVATALERGDRAIIADPDGAYAAEFYDPACGDLVLNPFDPRSMRWDLFGELRDGHDGDLIARALIPEQGGEDRAWRSYARVFLSACLRQLARTGCREIATLHHLIAVAPVEELRTLLAATPVGPYLSDDNARFFASVRAIATAQLAPLEHFGQAGAAPLALRDWVRPGAGARRVLFLPYRARSRRCAA